MIVTVILSLSKDLIRSCHPGLEPGSHIHKAENGSRIKCGMTLQIYNESFSVPPNMTNLLHHRQYFIFNI